MDEWEATREKTLRKEKQQTLLDTTVEALDQEDDSAVTGERDMNALLNNSAEQYRMSNDDEDLEQVDEGGVHYFTKASNDGDSE